MLELYKGALGVEEITNRWYDKYKLGNFGALVHFVGIVRDEDNISGLSFDVYKPALKNWFEEWQQRVNKEEATLLMAHSINDVLVHESSYIAGVVSPHRKVALRLIGEFVEDFKKNAPIWKYDLRDGKRVYAKEQSQNMDGAGLLS